MRGILTWIAATTLLVALARSPVVEAWTHRDVVRTTLWANGTPKETATFRDDAREGPCERFHPDGSLRAVGTFRSDKMEGAWRFFHENGSLDEARSGNYASGSRVKG